MSRPRSVLDGRQIRALHGKGECRKSSQQRADRDLGLEPRERRAEAVVDPRAKRQVTRLVSPEVEPVGLGEVRGVAVRGARRARGRGVPLRNRHAADLGVLGRHPARPLNRRPS